MSESMEYSSSQENKSATFEVNALNLFKEHHNRKDEYLSKSDWKSVAFKEFNEQFKETNEELSDYLEVKGSKLREYVILTGYPMFEEKNDKNTSISKIFQDTINKIEDEYRQQKHLNKDFSVERELSMCSKGFQILAQFTLNLIHKPQIYKQIPIKTRSTTYVYYLQRIIGLERIFKKLNYALENDEWNFKVETENKIPDDPDQLYKFAFHLSMCSVKCSLMATIVRRSNERLKHKMDYEEIFLLEAAKFSGEPYLQSWKICNLLKTSLDEMRYKKDKNGTVT